MRRFPLLLSCALLAVAVGGPVAAAEPGIVVRGTKSGWVDVSFPAVFGIDIYSTQFVSQAGRYAGFFAERVGQTYDASFPYTQNAFGALRVRDRSSVATIRTTKYAPNPPAQFDAGTYRFHIFADAAFEFRLLSPSLGRTVVVTPRRTVRPPYVAMRPLAAAGPTVWSGRESMTLPGQRSVVFGARLVEWGAGANYGVTCVARPGADCEAAYVRQSGCAGFGGQRCTSSLVAPPGALAAGRWDLVHRVHATVDVEQVWSVVLVGAAPAG